MADAKKISELTLAERNSGSDLFETSIPSALVEGVYASRKTTLTDIATFANKTLQFTSDLQTTSKTVIGAINELNESGGGGGGGASVIQLTSAEYDALSDEAKKDGSLYKLTDKAIMYCLDEEYHASKELTQAEYDALSDDEKNNGTQYIITDADLDLSVDDISDIATVAKTGSYSDLTNKPTIDTALSTTSTNAVTNGRVTTELNTKLTCVNVGIVNTTARTFTLPKEGRYLIVTAHNSSAGLNAMYLISTSSTNVFLLGCATDNPLMTLTVSGTSLTAVATSGGTAQIIAFPLT